MQPQQPYTPPPVQPLPPAPPAPQGGNYDFILNPQQPTKPKPFSLGGGSAAKRLALVVGGLFVLLVLFIGVKNMLGGSGNSAIPYLVSVAQDQQELIHLASSGAQNASATNVKDFAITAQLSLTSEQQQLLVYLSGNGHKVSTKELGLKIDKTTDTQLASAVSSSSFDPTFTSLMQTKLTAYQQALKQAFSVQKGPKGRALLNDDYTASQLLLKQLGS